MMNSNPMLSQMKDMSSRTEASMSRGGVAAKTIILLALMFSTALYSYAQPNLGSGILIASLVVSFILSMVTIFKPEISPWTAPAYALVEGVLLGSISQAMDSKYPGISISAVLSTGGVLLAMMVLFNNGLIVVNSKFVKGVMAAMVGILLIYLTDIILRLCGIQMPVVNDASPWGIAFSLAVVCVASLCIAIDLQRIEDGVAQRMPKFMEWYSAFALILTLVWLYLEILRLFQKIKSK